MAVLEALALAALFYGQYQVTKYPAYYDNTFGTIKCYDEWSCFHERGHAKDAECARHRWIISEYCSQQPEFQWAVLNCSGGDPMVWWWVDWFVDGRSDNPRGDKLFLEIYAELYALLEYELKPGKGYDSIRSVEELLAFACPKTMETDAIDLFIRALEQCRQTPEVAWCVNYQLPES